jgi:ribonuclease Z
MGRVVILGSASAVPDVEHENTHLLVEASSRIVLVDCPGSPVVQLGRAGIDPRRITDIILTHFHPDHVAGFAPLLMGLWLLGRKEPINVYGLEATMKRAQAMMELYEWEKWPNFYPVNFHTVPAEERAVVFQQDSLSVWASPVDHLIPTIGLRFDFNGQSMAYSCDTQPSEVVRRLADKADVLIHESTGNSVGHTSPEKAGEIAAKAGVRALYLIHYPPQLVEPETLLQKARQTFSGEVLVARDFMEIPLG